jgi:hypothetical protein
MKRGIALLVVVVAVGVYMVSPSIIQLVVIHLGLTG